MFDMINKLNLGKIRIWIQRLQGYLGLINFLMIGYVFLQSPPFNIQWYYFVILSIIFLPILMYIDIIYIFPQMGKYSFNKNPEFVDLKNELKNIRIMIENEKNSKI